MIQKYRNFYHWLTDKNFSVPALSGLILILFFLTACEDTTLIRHPTPTPSAQSAEANLFDLTESAKSVIKGQGIPEAAEFLLDSDLPHKFLIIPTSDSNYQELAFWTNRVSPSWLPRDINELELVILVEDKPVVLNSKEYISGGKSVSVPRVRHDLIVTIFEARSGKRVENSTTFTGGEPPGFVQTLINKTSIHGPYVKFETLQAWLCERGLGPCNPDFIKIKEDDTTCIFFEIFFSPDGKTLAEDCLDGGGNHVLSLWNTNNHIRFFEAKNFSFGFFAPDSKFLYVACEDGVARIPLTDPTNNEILSGPENILAASPNGSMLVSGTFNEARDEFILEIWKVTDSSLTHTLTGHTDFISSAIISSSGTHLASADYDGNIFLWGTKDGNLLNTFPKISEAYDMDFSHDDEYIVISPQHHSSYRSELENSVSVWRVSDGSLLYSLLRDDFRQSSSYLAISPDDKIIASGLSYDTVYLTQLIDGSLMNTLQHEYRVSEAIFSPDGQILATWEFENNRLYLWRVEDGVLLAKLDEHEEDIFVAAFSPDGKLLATATKNGEVIIWNLNNFVY